MFWTIQYEMTPSGSFAPFPYFTLVIIWLALILLPWFSLIKFFLGSPKLPRWKWLKTVFSTSCQLQNNNAGLRGGLFKNCPKSIYSNLCFSAQGTWLHWNTLRNPLLIWSHCIITPNVSCSILKLHDSYKTQRRICHLTTLTFFI